MTAGAAAFSAAHSACQTSYFSVPCSTSARPTLTARRNRLQPQLQRTRGLPGGLLQPHRNPSRLAALLSSAKRRPGQLQRQHLIKAEAGNGVPAAAPQNWDSRAHGKTRAKPSITGGSTSSRIGAYVTKLLQPVDGLWGKTLPMIALFFAMAFVNALLDATKDTLVVTAVGGAEVLPFLTVYAVLPMSCAFLWIFMKLCNALPRAQVFYIALLPFISFFALFALVLYPMRNVLHPHAYSDALQATLPAGLAGGVAVLREWTFSLFYVASELWGDVVLALLFWQLANEITSISEAHILYPLFGIGANVAQVIGGWFLRLVREFAPQIPFVMARSQDEWHAQLNVIMAATIMMTVVVAAIHSYIVATVTPNTMVQPAIPRVRSSTTGNKMTTVESIQFLSSRPQIRALAIMALSQGLSSVLYQCAWKGQVRELYPSPSDFSVFMGDVQTWTGIATVAAMVVSSAIFTRLGWAGAASLTPRVMTVLGTSFLLLCCARQRFFPQASILLQGLVYMGTLVYITERSAKFSLFKPAEEMVYIELDAESKSKGKAAIDVLGSQVGKSGGSLLQQALLVVCGSLGAALPVITVTYMGTVRAWIVAVRALATHHFGAANDEELETEDLSCDLCNRPPSPEIVDLPAFREPAVG
eukprot:jgi/Chlat1/2314/Chrsp17S02600